ncbi:hypothetical protein J9317_19515 [Metabacillus sp. KIGAM252]|uniref:Uncharacterized protein n=1 Tax=Metabacillus flavus TaxID=2823519 RepID=A0ABS5LJM2_9BACI|nr:hypothetical protein [Metabacillus flavus]MBS2970935.1 hypothetical protein [Metabacillus flavus]
MAEITANVVRSAMPGKPGKACDARQDCQTTGEKRAMLGKNATQTRKSLQCQARMPGKRGNVCDARQEFQANREMCAMPGKNARQTRKSVQCQARMPGKPGKACDARQDCQANEKKRAFPDFNPEKAQCEASPNHIRLPTPTSTSKQKTARASTGCFLLFILRAVSSLHGW